MKPGHGEVLLAEGDVEVAEEEERLVQEFRRQLDAGDVGRRPRARPPGAARRGWSRPSTRSRATPTASSSSRAPPAAPEAGARRDGRCCSPSAPRIVIVALLWELVLAVAQGGLRAPPGPPRARPRPTLRPRPRAPRRAARPRSCCARASTTRSGRCTATSASSGSGAGWPAGRGAGAAARTRAPAPRTPTSSTRTSRSSPTCRRPASCSASTASSSPTRRGPTAARGCPTPTTCWPSGWR